MKWNSELEKARKARATKLLKYVISNTEVIDKGAVFNGDEMTVKRLRISSNQYQTNKLITEIIKDDEFFVSWLTLISKLHEQNLLPLNARQRQWLIWLFSVQYRRMMEPPLIDVEFPHSPN
tara:strand:+ start:182 stop:544 length:363 start_codon:yes stop_codon:yes gene_type:complete